MIASSMDMSHVSVSFMFINHKFYKTLVWSAIGFDNDRNHGIERDVLSKGLTGSSGQLT